MSFQELVVFGGLAELAQELSSGLTAGGHGRRKVAWPRRPRHTLAPNLSSWLASSVGISKAYMSLGAALLLVSRLAPAQNQSQAPAATEPPGAPPLPPKEEASEPPLPVTSEPEERDASSKEEQPQAPQAGQTAPPEIKEPPQTAKITRPEPLLISSPPQDEVPPLAEDEEIILELVVDEEGRVAEAHLVRGRQPYARTTLEAAKDWLFKPATKNGKPVAARISFLAVFPASPSNKAEPQKGPQPTTPKTGAPEAEIPPPTRLRGEVLDEVVVRGNLRAPNGIEMTRLEVANLAGAFGDPLRAVESMPGVIPIVTGLPLFFIRGAPPGNVGYFIDGIRVPLLYHAFLGPSVLHPQMIRSVQLTAGPMPAQYGRYAGAAVEARLQDVQAPVAEGSIRLIDIGAYAQSRFDDNRGYAQLSGRYSYTGLLISLFSPGTRLDYWDYQARAGYALGRKDELSVMTLGAYDYVGADGEAVGGTEFHRVDLRHDHNFTPRDHLRTAVTWGKDRTRSSVGTIRDTLWGGRFNFEHQGRNFEFRSGADVWIDKYGLDLDPAISEPENYLALFPARTDVSGGIFTDVVVDVNDDLRVIPGLRFDHFTSLHHTKFSVDPRVTAEYQLTPRLRAIHALGTAHQSPNFIPNVPGAQVGGVEGGLQRSLQASAKYEYDVPWGGLTVSLAGFINGTQKLTDPIGRGQSFAIDETSAEQRSTGRSYGFEVYIKRALTKKLGGFLTYTYSTARRSYGRVSTRPGYDRPHVLNAALSYDFGWDLRASLRFALASGVAGRRTTLDGFFFDQSRSAPFVRLDAKLEKRFIVNEHLNWGIALEALNATYTGNVSSRTCGPEGCENLGTAPITLPNLGANVEWK